MDRALVHTSRALARVLRHEPERWGLALDRAGWVAVDALLAGARRAGVALDRATLEAIVRTNEKRRFTLSVDGRRIRAEQGHSVAVALDLPPVAPPEWLYHGTATRQLDDVFREGLRPMRRIHVHLSGDAMTARVVGARHGTPVVLRVAAGSMCQDGFTFFCADNGVWLTASVPPRYLTAEW